MHANCAVSKDQRDRVLECSLRALWLVSPFYHHVTNCAQCVNGLNVCVCCYVCSHVCSYVCNQRALHTSVCSVYVCVCARVGVQTSAEWIHWQI